MAGAPVYLTSVKAYEAVSKKFVKCSLLEGCLPSGIGPNQYSEVGNNMPMVGIAN
jgi:hypothetical protein